MDKDPFKGEKTVQSLRRVFEEFWHNKRVNRRAQQTATDSVDELRREITRLRDELTRSEAERALLQRIGLRA